MHLNLRSGSEKIKILVLYKTYTIKVQGCLNVLHVFTYVNMAVAVTRSFAQKCLDNCCGLSTHDFNPIWSYLTDGLDIRLIIEWK